MNTANKIVTLSTLKRRVRVARQQGQKIAFTNGCFDILHYGHVCYLQAAKKSGRVLVVGLNSDASVERLKGSGRPVNGQESRAAVLAALACVDQVTIFDSDTPLDLIAAVKPDFLIKGADWKGRDVVGGDVVKAHGGKVELIRYLPRFSTTKTIQRIRKNVKKTR